MMVSVACWPKCLSKPADQISKAFYHAVTLKFVSVSLFVHCKSITTAKRNRGEAGKQDWTLLPHWDSFLQPSIGKGLFCDQRLEARIFADKIKVRVAKQPFHRRLISAQRNSK